MEIGSCSSCGFGKMLGIEPEPCRSLFIIDEIVKFCHLS